MGRGRRRAPAARGRFEQLESRSLLAVAAFDVHFYEDHGGTLGAPLDGGEVAVGESFFAEITAREFDPQASGFLLIGLDVDWSSDSATLADDSPAARLTDALPFDRGGTADPLAGHIDDLHGAAPPVFPRPQVFGNLGDERFALLRFTATAESDAWGIALSEGDSRVTLALPYTLAPGQLAFASDTLRIVAPDDDLPAPAPHDDPAEDEIQTDGPMLSDDDSQFDESPSDDSEFDDSEFDDSEFDDSEFDDSEGDDDTSWIDEPIDDEWLPEILWTFGSPGDLVDDIPADESKDAGHDLTEEDVPPQTALPSTGDDELETPEAIEEELADFEDVPVMETLADAAPQTQDTTADPVDSPLSCRAWIASAAGAGDELTEQTAPWIGGDEASVGRRGRLLVESLLVAGPQFSPLAEADADLTQFVATIPDRPSLVASLVDLVHRASEQAEDDPLSGRTFERVLDLLARRWIERRWSHEWSHSG